MKIKNDEQTFKTLNPKIYKLFNCLKDNHLINNPKLRYKLAVNAQRLLKKNHCAAEFSIQVKDIFIGNNSLRSL